jgi:hypothetical protein
MQGEPTNDQEHHTEEPLKDCPVKKSWTNERALIWLSGLCVSFLLISFIWMQFTSPEQPDFKVVEALQGIGIVLMLVALSVGISIIAKALTASFLTMKDCSSCGMKIARGAWFCKHCGRPFVISISFDIAVILVIVSVVLFILSALFWGIFLAVSTHGLVNNLK